MAQMGNDGNWVAQIVTYYSNRTDNNHASLKKIIFDEDKKWKRKLYSIDFMNYNFSWLVRDIELVEIHRNEDRSVQTLAQDYTNDDGRNVSLQYKYL